MNEHAYKLATKGVGFIPSRRLLTTIIDILTPFEIEFLKSLHRNSVSFRYMAPHKQVILVKINARLIADHYHAMSEIDWELIKSIRHEIPFRVYNNLNRLIKEGVICLSR